MPEVFYCNPSASEHVTSSHVVSENLRVMHSTRKEFLKCESSEKIKHELRTNITSTHSELVNKGDFMYYKRNDGHEWWGKSCNGCRH